MGSAIQQQAVRDLPAPAAPGRAGPPARASRGREAAAVLALLVLAVVVRLPTLQQPLIEQQEFRQTQTAYTALLFHQHGVDLLHSELPVFGAPYEVPFEFPLFQALAAAPMSWGLSPDVALRTTALACFVVSAVLLWGLVRHVGGRTAALAALALFLFSPFSLLWSRASLIEYLAVAGALGWLWAGVLWRDRHRPVYAAAALFAGTVAMLVKPTTGAFWVLPLLLYRSETEPPGWRSWLRARWQPVLVGIVAVPFVAALLWTRHADGIKAASAATSWLTSSSLVPWNFGTLGQRLVVGNWSTIANRITTTLTGYPAWLLPLGALVGLRTRNARFWAALVAVPVVTVFVFWNLYLAHDYYLAALSPVPAAVAGYGFARVWHALAERKARTVLAAVLGAWVVGVVAVDPMFAYLPYRSISVDREFPAVAETARLTRPGDLIVFEGFDWEPVVPYYARRAGRMLPAGIDPHATGAELAADGYRVLVTSALRSEVATDTVRAGRWTGVLGRWVYITGDRLEDLRGAPVVATDDPVALAGPPLLTEPVTLTCGDGPVAMPRAAAGPTVLRLAPDTARTAKVSVAAGFGAVPARETILVSGDSADGPLALDCRDAATVTIVGVGPAAPDVS